MCLSVFASELNFIGSNLGFQFLESKMDHFLIYLRRDFVRSISKL